MSWNEADGCSMIVWCITRKRRKHIHASRMYRGDYSKKSGKLKSGSPFTPQKKMRNKSDSSMLFIRRPEECGDFLKILLSFSFSIIMRTMKMQYIISQYTTVM